MRRQEEREDRDELFQYCIIMAAEKWSRWIEIVVESSAMPQRPSRVVYNQVIVIALLRGCICQNQPHNVHKYCISSVIKWSFFPSKTITKI